MSEYEVVGPDYQFSEGDVFQQVYDVEFPWWMPSYRRREVTETLADYAIELESALDDAYPDGTEIDVTDTRLREIDDDTYRYYVTYHVRSVAENATTAREMPQDTPALTPAGIWGVIYLILIVLGIIGIAWVLRETRLLIETPGGSLALAGLLGVSAYAIHERSRSRQEGGG